MSVPEQPMEDERKDTTKPSCPVPTGIPINWSLITGPVPVPESVFLANTNLPPHHTSVHVLQTKVKTVTQRQTRGRDTEVKHPVFLRPKGMGQESFSAPAYQAEAAEILERGDVEVEVDVPGRLDIHSLELHVGENIEEKGSVRCEDLGSAPTGQSCLNEGLSLDRIMSENSSSIKDKVAQPPLPPKLSSSSATISASPSCCSSPSKSPMSNRHWGPPKGFWRVARPETLLLNGIDPDSMPSMLPSKDVTQTGGVMGPKPAKVDNKKDFDVLGNNRAPLKSKPLHRVELDRCAPKEADDGDSAVGLCSSESSESMSLKSTVFLADKKQKLKQDPPTKLREVQHCSKVAREQCGRESSTLNGDVKVDKGVVRGITKDRDTAIITQELEPYLRSLLLNNDGMRVGQRHQQARDLLEPAQPKSLSSSYSDQKSTVEKQCTEFPSTVLEQRPLQMKDVATQTDTDPPHSPQRFASPVEQVDQPKRYGCSNTSVGCTAVSQNDAESRSTDRVRKRERTGILEFRTEETDFTSSCSEKSRIISNTVEKKQEDRSICSETTTVIKEIIVLVKKCQACGSVVREPQTVLSSPLDQESRQLSNTEDLVETSTCSRESSNSAEAGARPKGSLTVTFAGAYVLGEHEETSTGWKSSSFGKLRRRSRKGESRIESGNGPYGPSWAQRRNSGPRNRVNTNRTVSFAPGSPVTLEPGSLASGGVRGAPAHLLPIKSALKSRNRTTAGQSAVQSQTTSNLADQDGSQHASQQDSPEARRDTTPSLMQGTPAASSSVPCNRPSNLRYFRGRFNSDPPGNEPWEVSPDGKGGDLGPECRPLRRGLALSRAEDLRAELLRAEHLKAGGMWDESSDGFRKLDGRPKLFLRRFFSSIGLNGVGRLVKGGRSSSMEQLSILTASKTTSASPSPTRRPQPDIHIQRTPSLQTLHTVLPQAQLRKASSVQSLERRTERTTLLGEVQIPYGLAPSQDPALSCSPQLELHRALSVEDVLASKIVRPVGWITQALPDGSLLLQLIRPPNGPFGFVISRGKGRPDTGVYVEKVVDDGDENPYKGLLGVGDEILEVNGEAVAGLSLDQVTRLMTRKNTASLRLLPTRRIQY